MTEHVVVEARTRGWDTLRNGELLDGRRTRCLPGLRHHGPQHPKSTNLAGRKIAIVVLGVGRWRLIKNKLAEIAAAVSAAPNGSCNEVEIPKDLTDQG